MTMRPAVARARRAVEPGRVDHHRERVATTRRAGEDVQFEEAALYFYSSAEPVPHSAPSNSTSSGSTLSPKPISRFAGSAT